MTNALAFLYFRAKPVTRSLDVAFGVLYVPNWFLIGGILFYVATWQQSSLWIATSLAKLFTGVLY